MKNLLPLLFIFLVLVLGCERTRNEVLSDSQIPPDVELVKISADDLASAYTRGKGRNFDNRADEKYLRKWLKVTGTVDSFYDKKDGFGYTIKFDTFAGDPEIECAGNYEEKDSEIIFKENQEITVVGNLSFGGNSRSLILNPCKFIK